MAFFKLTSLWGSSASGASGSTRPAGNGRRSTGNASIASVRLVASRTVGPIGFGEPSTKVLMTSRAMARVYRPVRRVSVPSHFECECEPGQTFLRVWVNGK